MRSTTKKGPRTRAVRQMHASEDMPRVKAAMFEMAERILGAGLSVPQFNAVEIHSGAIPTDADIAQPGTLLGSVVPVSAVPTPPGWQLVARSPGSAFWIAAALPRTWWRRALVWLSKTWR